MKSFIKDFITFIFIFVGMLLSYLLIFTDFLNFLKEVFSFYIYFIPIFLFFNAFSFNFEIDKRIQNFISSILILFLIARFCYIVNYKILEFNLVSINLTTNNKFVNLIKILFNIAFFSIIGLSIIYGVETLKLIKFNSTFEKDLEFESDMVEEVDDNEYLKKLEQNYLKKLSNNPVLIENKSSENSLNNIKNKNNNDGDIDYLEIEENFVKENNYENKSEVVENVQQENSNNNDDLLFGENNIIVYNRLKELQLKKFKEERIKTFVNKIKNEAIEIDIIEKEEIEKNENENLKISDIDSFLNSIEYDSDKIDPEQLREDINEKGEIIIKTLKDFGINSKIISYHRGPVVTRYEVYVDEKVNLKKIEKLEKNIAYNLSAERIRILAPIPGKKAVGFEIPNKVKEKVYLLKLLKDLRKNGNLQKFKLPVILGRDIDGRNYTIDLTSTPHMLIAGRTGSGKSVFINSLISNLILTRSPEDLRIILIDPKRVELTLYDDLPHLLTNVIVFPDQAALSLKWLVMEMERRYQKLKDKKVRNIDDYNKLANNEEKMPYLVLIIDEFYALIQVAQKIIEDSLIRLSSMARAVGIHLIFATQRPSSDVITGVIKSNLPTRVSFQTTSKTDSRIILDVNGAESLLGNGDMLFSFGGLPPIRVQGAFISTKQVKKVVDYVMKKYKFFERRDIIEEIQLSENLKTKNIEDDFDPLFKDAVEIVSKERKVSASYLQRRLRIGYNRAARIVEKMEKEGLIGPLKGNKEREIFI